MTMGSFYRELVVVAYHAASVDQARQRMAAFRARVAKLASLRSASA